MNCKIIQAIKIFFVYMLKKHKIIHVSQTHAVNLIIFNLIDLSNLSQLQKSFEQSAYGQH